MRSKLVSMLGFAMVAAFAITAAGCGKFEREITNWTGTLTYKCAKSGVEYVQSDSGLAVHVDKDGKPVSCGGN